MILLCVDFMYCFHGMYVCRKTILIYFLWMKQTDLVSKADFGNS